MKLPGILVLLVIACATGFLGACANAPAVAASAQAKVAKACTVFQPVAVDAAALYNLDPKVDAAIAAVNGLCAANAAVDPTSLQTIVNSTIPAAIAALKTLPITAAQQTQVGNGLMLVNVALAAALAAYGPVPAAATP